MIYREFTQEWINHISNFNHLQENNVLYDFFDYADNLNEDFKAIKTHYEKYFNSVSKKSIDKYYNNFTKLYNTFVQICTKNEECKGVFSAYYLVKNINSDVLITNGDKQRIKDKYYKKLKALAEEIFKIEESVSFYTEDIWVQTLTQNKEHSQDDYSYLVHAVIDEWRRQKPSEELQNYCDNLVAYSTSFVNNDKTKFFLERENKYVGYTGYIVSFDKGGFIAGGNNDLFTTEFVDGKCEYYEKYNFSPVKKLYIKGKSIVYGSGTRICTPQSAINSPVGTPSEILLDKDCVHLEKAFYVNPYGKYSSTEMCQKAQELAKNTNNSEPIRLFSFNKLNQIDYETYCEM